MGYESFGNLFIVFTNINLVHSHEGGNEGGNESACMHSLCSCYW